MGCLLSCCFDRLPIPTQKLPREEPTNKNVLFYSNEIRSEPDGDFIDNIHRRWCTDYKKLERDHGYIQWLFPLPERGMNPYAQTLTEDEIEWFKTDANARQRLRRSYEMMLGFYGVSLGAGDGLSRAVNWEERFENLRRNRHNNMRITRVIRCLSVLGFERLSLDFVKFLSREVLCERTLESCHHSLDNFWVPALQPAEQTEARQFIDNCTVVTDEQS